MTRKAPTRLLEGLTSQQATAASQWWRGLSPAEHQELSLLCDPRAEQSAYLRTERPDGKTTFQKIAIRVQGRFVNPGERSKKDEIPNVDFYEYLVNHEIILDEGPRQHICSAHEKARAAISSGEIPAGFTCPLENAECPMRALLKLAPGKSLELSLCATAEAVSNGD